MKITLKLFSVLLPGLLLFGCSDAEQDFPQPSGETIRFELGFEPTTGDDPETRVATSTDFKSVWEAGNEVGLFIVKGNGVLQASGNYVDNLKLTLQSDGTWSYTLPSGKEYYPNDGDNLSFYAYYPYNASMNPLSYTSAVPTDQHYYPYAYDFLWAKIENRSKSSIPVQLQFSHALAMVQVKAGIFDTWDVNVNLFEAITDYTVNLANQSIAPGSTKKNIKMWNRANTYPKGEFVTTNWVLLPPQTMNVRLGWTYKNTPYTATPATNVALAEGKVHKYDTWYSDPNRTYALGDAYPHPALAIGVVYEISNGGKNGKIVSLDEKNNRWGNDGVTTATDGANGLVNMRAIFNISPTFASYESFAWVHAKNNVGETYSNPIAKGVWYLPARNELSVLYNVKNNINTGLTSIGGTNLSATWYWSSTERAPQHASAVNFSDGNNNIAFHKGYDYVVRAIMAF